MFQPQKTARASELSHGTGKRSIARIFLTAASLLGSLQAE
jgi:hypothetical protein